MSISCSNVDIVKKNTVYLSAVNAATSSVADTAEEFVLTPTKNDDKTIVRVAVANTHGSVTLTVTAGDFWMGGTALTLTCVQNKTTIFQLESAKYLQSNGTYVITATPAGGKRLATDHAMTLEVTSAN